jgi:hypothetical protein
MFVFACPIIAKISVGYLPSTSGICAVVSKIICPSTKKDDA